MSRRTAAPGAGAEVVLAYRALKLGDLLTAVPALRALARAFPAHRRVLATAGWLEPLLPLTGTGFEVADVVPLAPLPPALAGADVAVNLHGRGPQSTAVLAASGPRRLVSFGVRGREWRAEEHEVARWCRLLAESGISADPADLRLAAPATAAPPAAVGATVVHPGAATRARRWPAERWSAVARAELAAGRRVVVTGSADERALALEVAEGAGIKGRAMLGGRTDLPTLAAVVAAAGRVVCGDTGVAHLASAYATPSVVLFGPVAPSAWGPPETGPHRALWAGTTGDPHADAPAPGLLAITVEEVLAALETLP